MWSRLSRIWVAVEPDRLRRPLTGLEGEALAKGVRIVQDLGLDKKYGYNIKPLSAAAWLSSQRTRSQIQWPLAWRIRKVWSI